MKLATVAWPKEPLGSWLAKAKAQVPVTMAAVTANYTLPTISGQPGNRVHRLPARTTRGQRPALTSPPDGRYCHTAVWTGSEMIVWGGVSAQFEHRREIQSEHRQLDSHQHHQCARCSRRASHRSVDWQRNDRLGWLNGQLFEHRRAIQSRHRQLDSDQHHWRARWPRVHTAVWTGSEMIVWGGYDGGTFLNTGGRYNPSTNSWTATSTTGAPAGRSYHTAVWTGSEMIVWGGSANYQRFEHRR